QTALLLEIARLRSLVRALPRRKLRDRLGPRRFPLGRLARRGIGPPAVVELANGEQHIERGGRVVPELIGVLDRLDALGAHLVGLYHPRHESFRVDRMEYLAVVAKRILGREGTPRRRKVLHDERAKRGRERGVRDPRSGALLAQRRVVLDQILPRARKA